MTDGQDANENGPVDDLRGDDDMEPARTQNQAGVLDDDADEAEDVLGDEGSQERTERRSDVVIVTLVFVVLFGYDLLEALQQLQQAPAFYEFFGYGEPPWALVYAAVAAPPILFALSTLVARGRRLVARAGILAIGAGLSAQVALLVEAWSRALL